MIKNVILALLMVFSMANVWAASDAETKAKIRAALTPIMPQGPDSIEPSIVPGLYEVTSGAQVFYVSPDGTYFFQGDVYNIKTRENVTDTKRAGGRKKIIDAVDPSSMIVFSPKEVKHSITVFTDIDCGYCRKMHAEMDAYLNAGIEIRYLAYPRSGLNTPSYDKAVAVWCADDKKGAITKAKAGIQVAKPATECPNPVADHFRLGGAIGVSGTPTLVMKSGKVIPGYVPAARLLTELEKDKL